ncbi:Nif3-like dinuclear metal center hexameric protein [Saccharothrix violaceirubra]|uniref:GTP cyclohydrolase 1 type 2 homolog n=1 Tax=Saccharothrix violaceirubra TaxID=413306 RepID=A0A7W7WZ01_9PSEU|nr:Nif3-like dinuclear metal center hexameric protein [Saccharothrix violaceirubra]MBB4968268.1 dinuclear metal center YbgI/SA1388 family protein [Saccharothrix violaceirubra]
MTTIGDVLAVLESAYPPGTAESWDAVGLVCGDRAEPVRRVLFCVDPVESTVDEAVEVGAELLVAHHPLLLRGVKGVPADDPKGALVHRLIRSGIALYTAHTNADAAHDGVSDALASALGLTVTGPLTPAPEPERDVLTTYVPVEHARQVLAALHAAGAGGAGDYRETAWTVDGTGQFRPVGGANPTIGTVGELEYVRETRIETVLDRRSRARVVAALRAAHPYEEVAFDLNEIPGLPGTTGIGRVGELPSAEPLAVFAQRVADALPATAWGVRAAGDPARPVKRVAVCGGAGDGYLGAATRAGVDAYVTSDLRHHPVSEHLAAGGPALVDVAHWAGEWPWCARAADIVSTGLGGTVDVLVSARRTDPWTVGATNRTGGPLK